MPMQDATGPLGQGPMTGRGRGPCGRGFGSERGYGRGRGFGWKFWGRYQGLDLKDEKEILENEKEILKSELEEIEGRLGELK